jgi:signal transduction histidine kinase
VPAIALSVGLALLQTIGTTFAGDDQPRREALDVLGYVLLIVGPAMLLGRKRAPIAVLIGTIATTLLYLGLGYPYGPVFLSIIVAIFTAVTRGRRLAAWLTCSAAYVGFTVIEIVDDSANEASIGDLASNGAWLLVVLVLSEIARVRRERILEARRAHEEEQRRQASDERLRIAQELHDVLAHNISLINVQASSALHLIDRQPERARPALTAIKGASDQALRELRSVLDVLRYRDDIAPRAPTLGIQDLDELVAGATATGLTVTTNVTGEPTALPPAVDLAAFRIVQEALTNVVRHAGATQVTVRIECRTDEVLLEVIDDGCGPATPTAHGGDGIAGMRERAVAQGGTLEAGRAPSGGFRVQARLPTRERP